MFRMPPTYFITHFSSLRATRLGCSRAVNLKPLKFKANPLHTLFFKIEKAGGPIGKVDYSTFRQWPAIIDAHDDNSAVLQVGDPHAGAKR